MDLPQPLQNEIVRLSRPGIDARRAMGIPPGKLRVPAELRSTLENMRLPYLIYYGCAVLVLPRYNLVYWCHGRHEHNIIGRCGRAWDMATGREFDWKAGGEVLLTEAETPC